VLELVYTAWDLQASKWQAWKAEAEAELKEEGHDDHRAKLLLFGRIVGKLVKAAA
jgi:hypothetical protein